MSDPQADPLITFNRDRQAAYGANDPMAHVCTVANVDANGHPQLRTLVLREVDNTLALFVNRHSPKWPFLQGSFSLLTYWPTVSLQYRMQVSATVMDAAIVHESWQLRPDPPKRMDWYYEQFTPQSMPVDSRETLLNQLSEVVLPEPLTAPASAQGLLLEVQAMERLDLAQPDGVHDRVRYEKRAGSWQARVLVP